MLGLGAFIEKLIVMNRSLGKHNAHQLSNLYFAFIKAYRSTHTLYTLTS